MRRNASGPRSELDRDGFADFVDPHLAVLRAVAVRAVGTSDADDVVQEALLRGWLRRSTYRPERGSARAWLIAILLDRTRRHRQRASPWTSAAMADPEQAAGSVEPERRLDIEVAIRQLPERQRQIVTLHYLADLSICEVADMLGVTDGAVKAQLFAARRQLKYILELPDEH